MNCRILSFLTILIFLGASCRPSPSNGIESGTMNAGVQEELRFPINYRFTLKLGSVDFRNETNFDEFFNSDHSTTVAKNVTIYDRAQKAQLIECVMGAFPLPPLTSEDITLSFSKSGDLFTGEIKTLIQFEYPSLVAGPGGRAVEFLKGKFNSHLEEVLNGTLPSSFSSECRKAHRALFNPPSATTPEYCQETRVHRETAPSCTCPNGKTLQTRLEGEFVIHTCIQNNTTTPDLDECSQDTSYGSIEAMDLDCECGIDPDLRHVVISGTPEYFCKLEPEPTHKIYEIFFEIQQADGCNQLTDLNNNLRAKESGIQRSLPTEPQLLQRIEGARVDCAKIHGSASCGIVSVSPKVIGLKIDGNLKPGGASEHKYLNHDFCPEGGTTGGTTGGNTANCVNYDGGFQGPEGDDNCGPGKNVDQCVTNGAGEKFLCTYTAPNYIWLKCGATCP